SCVAAFDAKNAATYAASLSNLNAPGTRDLAAITGAPDWTAGTGWIGKAGCTGLQVGSGYVTTASGIYTVAVRSVFASTVYATWAATSGVNQLN
ncbi:hypothetical protein, partial [Klebsiella pneumoniae]|uniref:hypothetical protein n=1 Tax=Klebsiella pneumoniae TaxID=573 RepID=UPI0025A057DF